MERLTYIRDSGQFAFKELSYEDEPVPENIAQVIRASRLAEYEDLGLTPKEILEQLRTYSALLCEITDNRMSKTNYTLEAIMGQVHDAEERFCEEDCDERRCFHDMLRDKEDGKLMEMPFIAMVEQSLQDGKMEPQRDQKFNGRYAVVYWDKDRWGCPLIDICGTHYSKEEAEARLKELLEKKKGEEKANG